MHSIIENIIEEKTNFLPPSHLKFQHQIFEAGHEHLHQAVRTQHRHFPIYSNACFVAAFVYSSSKVTLPFFLSFSDK